MNLAGTVLGDISSFSLTSGYLLSNSFDLQALIVKSMLIDDIALFGTHFKHTQISKFSPNYSGQGLTLPWRTLQETESTWKGRTQVSKPCSGVSEYVGCFPEGTILVAERCADRGGMANLLGGDVKLSAVWKDDHAL